MFPDAQIRTQHELVLLATLGPALMATKGMAVPEVEHTYTRARELCRQVGETPQLASVLFGLQTFYLVQGDYETSRELGQQLFDHAQRQHEAELFLLAHQALGSASFFQGELPVALDHFEQGITLYDAQRHRNLAFRFGQDSGMQCFSYAAWTLWLLGYPDQAVARIDDTLTLAKELSHPFSLARGLHYAAVVAQFRREGQSAHERAESTMTLATEQELV
jgi:predicted ATPase